jgi:hypothetical protein
MPFIDDVADNLALLKLLVMFDAICDDAELADEAAELSSDVILLDNPLAEPLALACIDAMFALTPLFITAAELFAFACAFCILLDTPADKFNA